MPCIDRPDRKAYFNLSVKVEDPTHIAISNTSVKEVKDQIYVFERTPLMSTYLLACIIGKFSFYETISKTGVAVRGYTPHGMQNIVDHFVKLAADSVDFYTDYFG